MRSLLTHHQAVGAVVVLMLLLLDVSAVVSAVGKPRSTKLPASVDPLHPRVNINWTEQSANVNLTKEERKSILRSKLVLTKLVVLNRHGHRAPNAPYWQMCPNDAFNKQRYDVAPEDLTGLGMQEEYHFGQYIRDTYHSFLGDKFNRSLHYFRAVGEPRILQSAMAVAQGIFPNGFGPGGHLPSRPQFVPVFSDMDTHEYLLDDVPCFRRAENDSHRWLETRYPDFIEDPYNKRVIATIKEMCGPYNGTAKNYAYIKTVADGLTFSTDFGLNVLNGKLSPQMLFDIRNVSLQLLMQRLYNTDEQQTYTVVDLPRSVLQTFNHTHIGDSPAQLNDFYDTRQESNFYFMHREALYAFAQFFGFQYNVAGLPPGEVPVAASLIMEKLMPRQDQFSHDARKIYVRIKLWTPYNGIYSIPISKCRIPELCELRELFDIHDTRVKRTGTWETLCHYKPQEIDHTTDIR
ncbi:putative acid phosphatase [Leptomonas pyrrhocoris]|uniref:Putative acid phosphatase n=1 Tax=Leptomonas pyrrhocoris TaxID=157538 RepID=A0A0M9G1C3_LEPPY|nr:putative acid phosphatase [Leptomonas pyrrhocoris]KPA80233.1 putative acid phosphatase [Leptomonas pyrrhocoris]|eukprot:XP_015658672.1 putative acid phosphatase [Leptomonas pyrrhocoris]